MCVLARVRTQNEFEHQLKQWNLPNCSDTLKFFCRIAILAIFIVLTCVGYAFLQVETIVRAAPFWGSLILFRFCLIITVPTTPFIYQWRYVRSSEWSSQPTLLLRFQSWVWSARPTSTRQLKLANISWGEILRNQQKYHVFFLSFPSLLLCALRYL